MPLGGQSLLGVLGLNAFARVGAAMRSLVLRVSECEIQQPVVLLHHPLAFATIRSTLANNKHWKR